MKRTRLKNMILLLIFALSSWSNSQRNTSKMTMNDVAKNNRNENVFTGNIWLYGESHGVKKIMDKEIDIWNEYYKGGMRHLFIENPNYTAEYLNIWMHEKGDDILNALYKDWEGSAAHNLYTLEFYRKIKENCPQTIFHGTDVGHQYNSIGERYRKYLEDRGLTESKQYTITLTTINQGIEYYKGQKEVFRENSMVDNFIRELKNINATDIMGIYGSAHTGLNSMDNSGVVPCMANQLKKIYGNYIHSEDLSYMAKEIDPIRIDNIEIGNKNYVAYYYGKQDLRGFKDFEYREFWRIENAYSDLRNKAKTGDVLPYDNYPMGIEKGQVFVITLMKRDGSESRMFFRADGNKWEGKPVTENIEITK